MIVTGVTIEQIRNVVAELNAGPYAGNLTLHVGREYSTTRNAVRVIPVESGARASYAKTGMSAPGARKSWTGRRLAAACWHAYRDVIGGVMIVNPNARVYTGMAKYVGIEGFNATYPSTADQNIGSMVSPAYMTELCDCDTWGIDTDEQITFARVS